MRTSAFLPTGNPGTGTKPPTQIEIASAPKWDERGKPANLSALPPMPTPPSLATDDQASKPLAAKSIGEAMAIIEARLRQQKEDQPTKID